MTGTRPDAVDSDAEDLGAETPDERDSAERDDDHLADVPVGSGCTEIWEHLAERRREDD